jgi:ABC-type uncharacterized transport system permease subunit
MALNRGMETRRHDDAAELDTMGWALFFVWSGVALLANLGWGWTLLGIAAIILGSEAYRRLNGLPNQGFWIAVGLICLLIAILDLLAIPWRAGPLVLIGFGVALMFKLLRQRGGSVTRRTE